MASLALALAGFTKSQNSESRAFWSFRFLFFFLGYNRSTKGQKVKNIVVIEPGTTNLFFLGKGSEPVVNMGGH